MEKQKRGKKREWRTVTLMNATRTWRVERTSKQIFPSPKAQKSMQFSSKFRLGVSESLLAMTPKNFPFLFAPSSFYTLIAAVRMQISSNSEETLASILNSVLTPNLNFFIVWDSDHHFHMLLSEEIEGLYNDGFEGSVDERRIFEDVFYGSDKHVHSEMDSPKKQLLERTREVISPSRHNEELATGSLLCKQSAIEQPKEFFGSSIKEEDDLLVAAIILNKGICSNNKQSTLNARNKKAMGKLKSQKGSCKLFPRSLAKGGKHFMHGTRPFLGARRTVLSWLLDVGVVSMNDVVQYRSSEDDAVVKDGRVTHNGILCKCCCKVLSVSEFKAHAGFRLYRPCLNLFMESGKSFSVCQLEAWSAEYKAWKGGTRAVAVDEMDQNDDTCGLCGDLICCDSCPSTFHQACLSAQEFPEGNWYFPNCTCRICGYVVSEKEASSSLTILKCTQCDNKYHGSCLKGTGVCKLVSDLLFCGANCQEVYSGLNSRIGVSNHIADGFSWALLRCIHGDEKVPSAKRFALMAECNSKLAVALTIIEECFLPMVDTRTRMELIPHVLHNWGSNFARLNYEGFYTVILEKGDEIISVASIRVHGVTVAEMPFIATNSDHRRRGMCRRLLNAIEEMLKFFKVERLVVAGVPSLVDTWTFGFGFEPMGDEERYNLNSINLMKFPGATLLRKNLYKQETSYRYGTRRTR